MLNQGWIEFFFLTLWEEHLLSTKTRYSYDIQD
jgi:hypothetical protein